MLENKQNLKLYFKGDPSPFFYEMKSYYSYILQSARLNFIMFTVEKLYVIQNVHVVKKFN